MPEPKAKKGTAPYAERMAQPTNTKHKDLATEADYWKARQQSRQNAARRRRRAGLE